MHAWTREEVKRAALGQLAEHGVEGLSLNAIAKQLGMTGPALYRYVGSRDELVANLVVDAWEDLSTALERAAEGKERAGGAARLRAIGLAYRAWAIEQPHRYRLATATPLGSGELAPERVIPAAGRGMNVILRAIADLPAKQRPTGVRPPKLKAQLELWGRRADQSYPPAVLLHGVVLWSRLHGLLMLELDGHLRSMGLGGDLLYEAELDALVGR
jgi:AcrR family transcriptional regulator